MRLFDIHEHLGELRIVCSLFGFKFENSEIAQITATSMQLARINGGELQNEETIYCDPAFNDYKLRFSAIMLDSSGNPHFLFDAGEDDIFYCMSCRLNGDLKEKVVFRIFNKYVIFMKFTPEVIAALQTLKDATENDFERHRIAVLEKDLTAPPVVEIIDDKHQKFDGLIYHTKDNGRYNKNLQLHRMVYFYYYGEIPTNYEIHHIDSDPSNNHITNLQCLSKSEHCALHNEKAIEYKKICPNCGKVFSFSKRGKKIFCSIKCSGEYHLKNPDLYEERKCEYCGKTFVVLKSSKVKCCSRACGTKLSWMNERKKQNIPEPLRKKTCPVCAKEFDVPKTNPKKTCCSRTCAYQYRKNKRTCKICPVCGDKFQPRSKKQKTCSRACGTKFRSQKDNTRLN